jgi:CheY-like chemotaxis protein/transcriptional regulator with XRE-family HTH domain
MEHVSIVSNSEIGAVIRRRRHELSWSLEKLGSMLNVSGQQIQRYESGENSLTVEKLQEIAHTLSVPICYFFFNGSSQKSAQPNECYEIFKNIRNLDNQDVKDMITDFVRIAVHKGNKGGVPALRLGHYMKQNPILLVDDDEQVLSITKLFLENEGYRNLHVIQDSRSVIPFLKEKEVSMILLDLMMPHISGKELLCTLRNDFPNIPVIIMTGIGDLEIAEECKKLGALDYLVKPVDPKTLLSAIEKAEESMGRHLHGLEKES